MEVLEPRVLLSGSIGGLVWFDLDGDGVRQGGEAAVAGVQVELFEAGPDGEVGGGDDVSLGLRATDGGGEYIFEGLAPGLYWLRFSLPAGCGFAPQDRGDDALDSDADPATGLSAALPLDVDANDLARDVGLVLASSPAAYVLEGGDNDTQATATALALAEDPAGSGYRVARGLGTIQPRTDADWWSFEVQAGDVVSVAVDTPLSDLDPYVRVLDAEGNVVAWDDDAGPNADSLVRLTVAAAGRYYVEVTAYEAEGTGAYEIRVDLARGIQLETDGNYANDRLSGANALTLSQGGVGERVATVAGTIMAPEWSNTDEDYYALGTLAAGTIVELTVRLPSGSTLQPKVVVVDSSGTALADADGDPEDGHVLATVAADGVYYARVESPLAWSWGGNLYLLTEPGLTWAQTEDRAQALGGHLATVNDAAENEWLWRTFGRFGSFWIGLTDEAAEGTWAWAGGQAADYANWASGRPDVNNTTYNYAYVVSDGRWYDGPGAWTYYGVVEREGAGPDRVGPGPAAQYLLDVSLVDAVPPRVTDVAPLPAEGGTTDAVIDRLVLSLSEDLATATVVAANFDLREAGPDGLFDTPDDLVYALVPSPAYTAGTGVGLLIPGGPLPGGTYRFTALAALTDRAGNPLDGDGAPGDPFQRTFHVALPAGYVFEGGDNDTQATATSLVLVEDPAGSGYWVARGLGSLQTGSDADWWSFEALAGDVVSVGVDSPRSDADPYVWVLDAGGNPLGYDDDGGPDSDALVRITIPASGRYYVEVTAYDAAGAGAYEVRVDVARGIQLETDGDYVNDDLFGADVLMLVRDESGTLTATVAGTIMVPEGDHADVDLYALGTLDAGTVVELSIRRPSTSTLRAKVTVVDATGAAVMDVDSDPEDACFRGTIPADGAYYARVESPLAWSWGGNLYLLTDPELMWDEAQARAQTLGGNLVTVNDAAENEWLWRTFSPFGTFWTGLALDEAGATWGWVSGQTAAYANWAAGWPDGDPGAAAAYLMADGLWYNGEAALAFYGVVEVEGAGAGPVGPGPWAQYLLDVLMTDSVAPRATDVLPLPADGETTPAVIDRLALVLSEDLDAATVDALNFDLREAGPDGVFDTEDDLVYRLTPGPVYTTGTALGLLIQGGPLPTGSYRLTARETLLDRAGNALDGDADGTPGDPYRRMFQVAIPAGFVLESASNDAPATATALPLVADATRSRYYTAKGLGSIQTTADADWWSFEASAGDIVTVALNTPDSALDPYLRVLDAQGNVLADDNDSGPDADAFVLLYISSTGTYYVEATAYRGPGTGRYEILIDRALPEPRASAAGAARFASGDSSPGGGGAEASTTALRPSSSADLGGPADPDSGRGSSGGPVGLRGSGSGSSAVGGGAAGAGIAPRTSNPSSLGGRPDAGPGGLALTPAGPRGQAPSGRMPRDSARWPAARMADEAPDLIRGGSAFSSTASSRKTRRATGTDDGTGSLAASSLGLWGTAVCWQAVRLREE